MRIVVAVGGNALLKRGEPLEANIQRQNARIAAQTIAELAQQHEVVVVHGNGPQVGLLAVQAANDAEIKPYPLDVLTAETQGMIGYLLLQEIHNILPSKKVATLLTQVIINSQDPAFSVPEKFIGRQYNQVEADVLIQQYGWKFKMDGHTFRRVVASPKPQSIIELPIIADLLQQQTVVICGGGGGIPVIKNPDGQYTGIEAVIDKDATAALLAIQLQADLLIILTDVTHVILHWGTSQAQPLEKIAVTELRQYSFAAGSMQPKVSAACDFVKKTGKRAAIGALQDGSAIVQGQTGTQIFAV